jgi:O-antigen ligase
VPKLAGNLYLVIAAVLTVNYVTDLRTLRTAVFAWLAGTAANILATGVGLVLFFSGLTTLKRNPFLSQFGTLPPGHYPRIRGLFLNADMMGAYMAGAVMIVVAARQMGWISLVAFRWLFAGAIVTAAFSISPALGGLCLVLAIWQSRWPASRARARFLVAAGLAIALIVFIGAPISMTPLTRTSVAETILHPEPSGRLMTWTGAWYTFLAHPWTGQGLESEAARFITSPRPALSRS